MPDSRYIRLLAGTFAAATALAACSDKPTAPELSPAATDRGRDHAEDDSVRRQGNDNNQGNDDDRRRGNIQCAADNAGLTLPRGFCAVVFADLVVDGKPAAARHMAITPKGDVFVAINASQNTNPSVGIIGLRDSDGDGVADKQSQFSQGLGGSGLAWDHDMLYFGANDRVVRYRLKDGDLNPQGGAETVVSGLPNTGDHISKTVVIGDRQSLYVNIGSASNACQVQNRVAQSPGKAPCPELPMRAGVWKFDARGTNQQQSSGEHYATGYRNLVALDLNPRTGELWGVQHGRDMLFENWPQFFNQEQDATMPAEEFARITRGSNNGWPYCFYDAVYTKRKLLAPEYGGDGNRTSGSGINCASYNQPFVTFGAHWAPNGLHFYTGRQFPRKYRDGAFIAFHGGFDRAPLPNEGFQVQFVQFTGSGRPVGGAEKFADGFAGPNTPLPANAQHRPVGVAEGPDGSLYVSDDRGGRIYRIIYKGN